MAAMKLLDLPKSTFYRFLAEDNAGADMLELGLLWDKVCRVAEQQEILEPIIVPVTDFYYNKKKRGHGTVAIRPDALQDPERKYSLLLLQPDDSRTETWRPYTLYPGSVDDPEVLRRMDPIPAPVLWQVQGQLETELNKLLQTETEREIWERNGNCQNVQNPPISQ